MAILGVKWRDIIFLLYITVGLLSFWTAHTVLRDSLLPLTTVFVGIRVLQYIGRVRERSRFASLTHLRDYMKNAKVQLPGYKEGYFTSRDGTRIYYHRCGFGPKIVFLANGLGAREWMWLNFMQDSIQYLNEFTFVSWDYRGMFASGPPPPGKLNIRDLAEDILDLMNVLGVERAHTLIGWSTGVQIALQFAAMYGERVDRLVLMNGSHGHTLHCAFQPIITVPLIPELLNNIAFWVRRFTAKYWDRTGPLLYRLEPYMRWLNRPNAVLFGNPLLEWSSIIYLADVFGYQEERNARHTHFTMQMFQELGAHSALHLLPEIRTKTLIIGGGLDILTPVKHSLTMHHRMPDARLFVKLFASHFALFEYPEEITSVVHDFMFEHAVNKYVSSNATQEEARLNQVLHAEHQMRRHGAPNGGDATHPHARSTEFATGSSTQLPIISGPVRRPSFAASNTDTPTVRERRPPPAASVPEGPQMHSTAPPSVKEIDLLVGSSKWPLVNKVLKWGVKHAQFAAGVLDRLNVLLSVTNYPPPDKVARRIDSYWPVYWRRDDEFTDATANDDLDEGDGDGYVHDPDDGDATNVPYNTPYIPRKSNAYRFGSSFVHRSGLSGQAASAVRLINQHSKHCMARYRHKCHAVYTTPNAAGLPTGQVDMAASKCDCGVAVDVLASCLPVLDLPAANHKVHQKYTTVVSSKSTCQQVPQAGGGAAAVRSQSHMSLLFEDSAFGTPCGGGVSGRATPQASLRQASFNTKTEGPLSDMVSMQHDHAVVRRNVSNNYMVRPTAQPHNSCSSAQSQPMVVSNTSSVSPANCMIIQDVNAVSVPNSSTAPKFDRSQPPSGAPLTPVPLGLSLMRMRSTSSLNSHFPHLPSPQHSNPLLLMPANLPPSAAASPHAAAAASPVASFPKISASSKSPHHQNLNNLSSHFYQPTFPGHKPVLAVSPTSAARAKNHMQHMQLLATSQPMSPTTALPTPSTPPINRTMSLKVELKLGRGLSTTTPRVSRPSTSAQRGISRRKTWWAQAHSTATTPQKESSETQKNKKNNNKMHQIFSPLLPSPTHVLFENEDEEYNMPDRPPVTPAGKPSVIPHAQSMPARIMQSMTETASPFTKPYVSSPTVRRQECGPISEGSSSALPGMDGLSPLGSDYDDAFPVPVSGKYDPSPRMHMIMQQQQPSHVAGRISSAVSSDWSNDGAAL